MKNIFLNTVTFKLPGWCEMVDLLPAIVATMLVVFPNKRVANKSKQHKLCCPHPHKKKKETK